MVLFLEILHLYVTISAMITLLNSIAPLLRLWLRFVSNKNLQTEGTLQLKGLNSGARIVRDRWGIPHIYAEDKHDLLFAQGYAHAQDRLWQMDFQRRAASGRLSEIFGSFTIDIDRWVRILALNRAARLEEKQLEPAIRLEQHAYCEGINSYIKKGRLPAEFRLLRYEPDPWRPIDTMVWYKLISWNLSVNWESELLRSLLIQRLGEKRTSELEPGYFDHWPTILSPAQPGQKRTAIPHGRSSGARSYTGLSPFEGTGSNCWTLSGNRSKSGYPILCNDMHLVLSAPAIWYENHLSCDELKLAGITTPGIPFIVSGHNSRVAWGFTAGMSDVQDLYYERVRKSGADTYQYEYMGKWYDMEAVQEIISVKKSTPVMEKVLITRHGPIINELTDEIADDEYLSLRWIGSEEDSTSRALYGMLRSKNCHEFRNALADWVIPNLNIHYADTEGTIGYTHAGRIPVRRKGDGSTPVPGWTNEYEWQGYIPFHELPHIEDPEYGYIISANNRIVENTYPFHLGRDYISGDRAGRIEELLKEKKLYTINDMKTIQTDIQSHAALAITWSITASFDRETGRKLPLELQKALRYLRDWDGVLHKTSTAAALYETCTRILIRSALGEELGPLIDRYMGKGPTPVLGEYSMFCWHSLEWLRRELDSTYSRWYGSPGSEKRKQILTDALMEGIRFLKKKLGRSMKRWMWGELHTLTFFHPLGRVRALAGFFNRGPYPVDGDGTTVWASFSNMHNLRSDSVIGPPYRFIADLSDLDHSSSVLVPGQSGNPANPQYDDQIEEWFNGKYHTLYTEDEDVQKAAIHTLHLLPLA